MRKPAALASAVALVLAVSACTDDDPSDTTSGLTDTTGGVTDTTVGATTTIAEEMTTTTAAG
jgi:hypothetical protein